MVLASKLSLCPYSVFVYHLVTGLSLGFQVVSSVLPDLLDKASLKAYKISPKTSAVTGLP